MIIVAIIYIPYKLGGWGDIFDAATGEVRHDPGHRPTASCSTPTTSGSTSRWRFGSALALFLYPHSITGVLASRNRNVIKRNMSALPAYSLLLGLIALLGYMAIAAERQAGHGERQGGHQHGRTAAVRPDVPALVRRRRLRRHRHRRAGAGGDHVDRRGEPVHPQHLQGVPQPRAPPAAGGHGSARSSRWWSRSARSLVILAARPAVLDRPAADRRRHHPADAARGRRSASTPGGSTAGAWSPAGWPAWGWACGCSTRSRTRRPTTQHFGGSAFAAVQVVRPDRDRAGQGHDRLRGLHRRARQRCSSRSSSRSSAGPRRHRTAWTPPRRDDYFADEGEPRVAGPTPRQLGAEEPAPVP